MGRDMQRRVLCWMLIACLVGWAGPLHAFDRREVEHSVVRIINQNSQGESSGSGTVINATGHILTNHHVIAGSNRLLVFSKFSNAEQAAEVVWKSSAKDLAVIRVSGLTLPPAPLFTGELKAGSDVFAMGYPGAADGESPARTASLSKGILSHFFDGTDIIESWSVAALQHAATVTGGNSGGPLFDDCGRVIGVNTARPHILTRGGRAPDNSQINWASHIKESINLLRQRDIAFSPDADPCVSAAGGADPAATRAAEEAKQSASTAESKAENARQGAQQAQQQAEQATQAAEEALQVGRMTNTLVALVAVVTLLALGLALRKPRQEIMRVAGKIVGPLSRLSKSAKRRLAAVRSQTDPPQIALTGFDPQGRPVKIELRRPDLDRRQGGFTVGRHPLLVDQVLNDERLSRRHARFYGVDGAVFVEDLNSSNGTTLNGAPCAPFEPMQIQPGDIVSVGNMTLRVSR